MKVLLELLRGYVASVPKKEPGAFHLIVLRIIFLFCAVTVGVLGGAVLAFFVFMFTARSGNGLPALYTFFLFAAASTLYGLYTAIFVMSNREH